jgi:NitT/TauT family transport system permease protein
MSSSDAGSTLVKPRTELTITGKKVMSDTITTRGSWLSNPNQLIMIGARAMMGTALIAVPIIALAPIMINWFGFESQLPRVAIVGLMTFFQTMVNSVRGLTSVDEAALELMASYAATERDVLRRLRIPSALPYWFTALRISVTLAVIGAVVGEFFGGPRYAIGIYVTDSAGNFRFENAWAAIVLACALGIVLYLAAVAVERVVMPWQRRREAAAAA